jgi:molybdate transport system substrate-binding protein
MVVVTQILTTPGIELVGPLPPKIQSYITFTGAVSANARVPETASKLLQFLRGPHARRAIKAQGMEPSSGSPC